MKTNAALQLLTLRQGEGKLGFFPLLEKLELLKKTIPVTTLATLTSAGLVINVLKVKWRF
jgi:hypothetical protein